MTPEELAVLKKLSKDISEIRRCFRGLLQRRNNAGKTNRQDVGRGHGKMTEIDVDKDEAFKAIKDSIRTRVR